MSASGVRTVLMKLRGTAAAVLLLMLTLAACAMAADKERSEAMDSDPRILDFTVVRTPSRPNAWLVAPPATIDGEASEPAPVLPMAAPAAAAAWLAIIESEPRTGVIAISPDGLRIEAEQRSAGFGFVDRISAWFIPMGNGRSTLAVYSRAQTGYWDLGVNKRRVRDWLQRLAAEAADPEEAGMPVSAEDPA
jgi:uncharacterized protein (DUF1499 family)